MKPSESFENAIALARELEMRAPSKHELADLFRICRQDTDVIDALCASARAVRDKEGLPAEREAALNSVLRCHLKPLCTYCPYWRTPGQQPMTESEILESVRFLSEETDVRQFHLSGGSRRDNTDCGMTAIVRSIREAGHDDMDIVVNCGAAFNDEELAELKELGVIRVFSVFETMNPSVFDKVKPGDDLDEKIEFAQRIAKAHLQVGSGIMAGINPSESAPDDYAYELTQLAQMDNLTCVYISKFRNVKGIPLEGIPDCTIDEARTLVALTRLTLRSTHIRAAAGWKSSERKIARDAGAGSISIVQSFSPSHPCWW